MVKYHLFGGVERDIDIPKSVFPTEDEIRTMESSLPGCEHGWFESVHDHLKLHYRKFLPIRDSTELQQPKAIVIWMHGIQTHCGRAHIIKERRKDNNDTQEIERKINMALLSETCLQHGYALYCFDMIGHGYSEGNRFYIPDYNIVVKDYLNFVKLAVGLHTEETKESTIPLFLSGESFGANLTIQIAKYYQDHVDLAKWHNFNSVILLAPAIIGDMYMFPIYWPLKYFFNIFFSTWKLPHQIIPNPVHPKLLWRDEKVLFLNAYEKRVSEMLLEPCERHSKFGTQYNMFRAFIHVRDEIIPYFHMPFCVMHGVEDYAVPIKGASDYLVENVKTSSNDIVYHRIEHAYHDLLGDPSTPEVIRHMFQYIQQRIEVN